MSRTILIPVLLLASLLAPSRAQPGPELPPAPAVDSTSPVVPSAPEEASSAPAELVNSADSSVAPSTSPVPEAAAPDSAAVAPAPSDATDTPPDTLASGAGISEPSTVPSSGLDSVAAPRVPSPGVSPDSLLEQQRRQADLSRRRPTGSFMGKHPPSRPILAPPVVKAAPIDSTPAVWEDERGAGRRLKSDPKAHRLYRSPRKAFFYSLVLPGAGQAWCGAWVRAGVFAAAEVGLAYGWYDISIRQAREASRDAQRFADENWSAARYENARKRYFDSTDQPDRLSRTMPYRDRYCEALYAFEDNVQRDACRERPDTSGQYQGHLALLADSGLSVTQVRAQRQDRLKDPVLFYERIGRDAEFVPGWRDATSDTVTLAGLLTYEDFSTDNDPSTIPASAPWGVSQMRAQYLSMRRDADDLAATQGWFLGGLVLNHLASALDAALTAQRHNRKLYDEEKTTWWDGLHFQGGLAWSDGPATRADAFLEF
ncbi:MAG: hypothetical protein H6686_04725 [Fibrobacteria bacterium]|nr:hypothetical protein [Fibrobacteria bacterium]